MDRLDLRPLAALFAVLWVGWSGRRLQAATSLSIGDGDTIRVQQDQQRITIRLACIDAPEMAPTPAATCNAGCGWAPA